MNNTKKLPTTGIKPTIESFFAISVCHFRDQRECKGIAFQIIRTRLMILYPVPLGSFKTISCTHIPKFPDVLLFLHQKCDQDATG
jgi:hypothetical protein